MAASTTTIRRRRPSDGGDKAGGSNTNSSSSGTGGGGGGIKIHPVLLGILLSLVVNFFRARIKQFHKNYWSATPTTTSTTIESEFLTTTGLAASSREGGALQVSSPFIKDPKILEKFNNDQLWRDCIHQLTAQDRWMDFGLQDKPKNIWEEIILKIWDQFDTTEKFAGYEYWCNVLEPATAAGLDWHVDKDEIAYERQDKLITPYMGAVWYGYPHQMGPTIGGGNLEIFPFHPYEHGDSEEKIIDPTSPHLQSIIANGVERIAPIYNRLIFLNVSQWHRVTPITDGKRYTFAVNAWKQKPMSSMALQELSQQQQQAKTTTIRTEEQQE